MSSKKKTARPPQEPLSYYSPVSRLKKEGYRPYWHRHYKAKVWVKPPRKGQPMYIVRTSEDAVLQYTKKEFEELFKKHWNSK